MAETGWLSTDLLALFNRYAGRPPSADVITDATKYDRLAKAQTDVIADIIVRYPQCLYPTAAYSAFPTATNVSNGNQLFTFGTDGQGYAVAPMGKTRIYANLSDFPDNPLQPGRDYVIEGTQIRIPNNNTYSGTLYWYGIAVPTALASSVQSVLFPEPARLLIVYKAVGDFALEGNRNPALADQMDKRYGQDFARWMTIWRTSFRGGGALAPLGDFGPVTSAYYTGGGVVGNALF